MSWHDHPLCGPRATQPDRYWGPEQLDGAGFRELLPLCAIDAEVAALAAALVDMHEIVDIGGGTGALADVLARRSRVIVIEPDASQRAHVPPHLEARAGRAEQVPLEDRGADAAMATWVLQYTDDPFAAIGELARVARHRVAIVQAAPNNDLVEVYNREAAMAGQPPGHHGWLLAEAATRLEAAGFAIELAHIPIAVRVPSPTMMAELLSRLHFAQHPARAAMAQATAPFVASRGAAFCDDAVLLIARR